MQLEITQPIVGYPRPLGHSKCINTVRSGRPQGSRDVTFQYPFPHPTTLCPRASTAFAASHVTPKKTWKTQTRTPPTRSLPIRAIPERQEASRTKARQGHHREYEAGGK